MNTKTEKKQEEPKGCKDGQKKESQSKDCKSAGGCKSDEKKH